MRIALVTPGYEPDAGGVEAVVSALAPRLAAQGHQVQVWTHAWSSADVGADTRDGVRVHRFATRPGPGSGFALSPSLWRFAKDQQGGVDLVHAHSFHSSAAVATLRLDPAVPVVFSPHYHGTGHTPLARALHLPYAPVGRRVFARADRVVAVSRAESELLIADGRAAAPDVVANAVDWQPIHQAAPFDTEPTVLAVGRLEEYKNVAAVIAAFDAQDAAGQLIVIGDGPERENLAALARRARRAGDIRLLGRIERRDLARWFRTALVTVSMSRREAFGIVGLEGVAGGSRALLSDIPAHHEVVQLAGADRARVLTEPELAAAIATALRGPRLDPTAVRSWDDAVSQYVQIYESVVAGARSSS